jgi:transposase
MQKTPEGAFNKLYLAIDLGGSRWKLAFWNGEKRRPRVRTVPARNLAALLLEISVAKVKLDVADGATVSCFEAGRDGFWLHRFLEAHDVMNFVVDPGSIETDRRARRVKTDRVDAEKLVTLLVRHDRGEPTGWRVVNVPTEEDEDARRLHRDLRRLNKERTALRNRIHNLLATEGLSVQSFSRFGELVGQLRRWDGTPLPNGMQRELERVHERLQLAERQIRELRAEQKSRLEHDKSEKIEKVRRLTMLKGVGLRGGWLLVMEFFGWRRFRNRKEVGALAGLTSTPYDSDGTRREQGISKAGNGHIRSLIVELAWMWLRYQPDSALSRWFNNRWGPGSSRSRRVGIVALARKLLVALWRFVEHGVVPDGAEFKPLGAPVR